ncbi:unnamed protein product [Paramecium sonneborni]|uniref:1-phosphatidylinositol 4-kinase n=1 Tax=Paramecium sonneborni TaxID=65129 RepID=A0A8S1L953_9CILI|nr:unnamed protein product [Paramecium sonneborni]
MQKSDQNKNSGCLCFGKKQKGEFPKTFKKSGKILKKYKDNSLDISDDVILEVMIRLYISENKGKAIEMLQRCRINPNFESNLIRNDLEYFIPQLINFLVFHQQLSDERLISFINKASQIDFFFAHLVYFQLKSLSQIVAHNNKVELKIVQKFVQEFEEKMSENYQGNLLIATQFLKLHLEDSLKSSSLQKSIYSLPSKKIRQEVYQGSIRVKSFKQNEIVQLYGTSEWEKEISNKSPSQYLLRNYEDIQLEDYRSIFQNGQDFESIDAAFQSNINFWNDITEICNELSKSNSKTLYLQSLLNKMNANLPAAVYVPFVKNSIRNYAVLNIVSKESRVFSTKMRSPYSLTLEIYRPEIEVNYNEQEFLDKQMSQAIKTNMIKNNGNYQSQIIIQQEQNSQVNRTFSSAEAQNAFNNEFKSIKFNQFNYQTNEQESDGIGLFYNNRQTNNIYQDSYQINDTNEMIDQQSINQNQQISNQTDNQSNEESNEQNKILQKSQQLEQSKLEISSFNSRVSYLQDGKGLVLTEEQYLEIKQAIFGENSLAQQNRIKMQSPFQTLKSWKLVHLIIKTGDNLKQEQFALQLICQFDQIFKKEGLPLQLRYYEVLSLGPDCGIIEMVKNATTIDSLQKNLQKKFTQFSDFSDFFRSFFRNNIEQALQNYVQSLVAYCLVCYFLQVKDRHNGNILLDDEGHLIHIDFGFFLSIAPGKGMEFEGKVPFKLLSDYIKVLGGVKGTLFQDHFRKLFYKGFKACQKHQNEILLLVDMMFTGHGTTLPCFQKGEVALKELENRFNPRVASDAELYVYVQELINKSLDNWRARWYDKFQYFAQGIFY